MSNLDYIKALKPSNHLPGNVGKRNKQATSGKLSTQDYTNVTHFQSPTIKVMRSKEMELLLQNALPPTLRRPETNVPSNRIRNKYNTKIDKLIWKALHRSLQAPTKKSTKTSQKAHIKIHSLVFKTLAEKIAEHEPHYRDTADNAIKTMKQSNHLTKKEKKLKKTKGNIDSMILKVMAQKICEMVSQPATQMKLTITNGNIPVIASTMHRSTIKLEIKQEPVDV